LSLLALWFLVPWPAAWIEVSYSRTLYPAIARALIPTTAALPFSLAALLVILLPLVWLIVSWQQLRRGRGWWPKLGRVAYATLWFVALIAFGFVVTWGANYRRQPVEVLLGLQAEPIAQADAEALLAYLAGVIREHADAAADSAAALAAASIALQGVTAQLTGVRPVLPRTVKRLPAGTLIRLGSAYGVISPWTLEAHVDGALPEVAVVGVGIHELAHLAGFAGEADTDLIAALAGLQAEHAYARYATALRFWELLSRQLPANRRAELRAQLPERAREDLTAMAAPFAQFRPPPLLQQAQRLSYDAYLRAQGVEAGIADYGRAATLLLWAFHQGHLAQAPQ
jgi:hypothetical protein